MESYLIISKLTKGFTGNYFPDDNNNYYIAYYPRSESLIMYFTTPNIIILSTDRYHSNLNSDFLPKAKTTSDSRSGNINCNK